MKNRKNLKLTFVIALIFFCQAAHSKDLPFTRDIDHDGFPDDLEIRTGYNHRLNEALVKSNRGGKCGMIKTDLLKLAKPHNILLILDGSGSMKTALGSGTRMGLAKKILKKYIDSLPQSIRLGFVLYGKASCGEDSIELIAPIGKSNRSRINSKIDAIRPGGLTPIAMTLNRSYEYFKGIENENNTLILISDGMESCGGNPVKAIIDLKVSLINPDVFVIGLGVDRRTRRQLSQIASSSGGTYSDVKNEKDLVKAFSGFFNKLSGFYKDILCIVSQYNAYLTYETQQYNKSKSFLLRKKLMASGNLKKILEDLEQKLDRNHKERVKVKDLLIRMVKNKTAEIEEATRRFVTR